MKITNTSSIMKRIRHTICAPFSCVLIIVLVNLSFISCKKNNTLAVVETPQVQNTPSPTLAPVPTTTIIIDSNNTNINITNIANLKATYIGGYPWVYKCFIDIDADGIMDISFKFITNTSWGGMLLESRSIDVETLNNNTCVLTDSICQRTEFNNCTSPGKQTIVNSVFPKPLNYGEMIDVKVGKWKTGLFFLYNYKANIDTAQCHTSWLDGPWYSFNGPKYMAVKCKGKPVWLKFQVDISGYIYLHNFALVKF